MLYILGHIGTRPKMLGIATNMDEAQIKRAEAAQDGYGDVMLVYRSVISFLEGQRLLLK